MVTLQNVAINILYQVDNSPEPNYHVCFHHWEHEHQRVAEIWRSNYDYVTISNRILSSWFLLHF